MPSHTHSRRGFLQQGSLALASMGLLPWMPGLQFHDLETGPMRERFTMGMAGYTFLHCPLPECIGIMKRVGLTDMSLKDFYLPLNSTQQQARAFVRQMNASGLRIYAVGVIYMHSKSEVDQAFTYAQHLGVSMIIGSPDPELLPYIEQHVKSSGIALAIHNHGPEDPIYPDPYTVYDKVRHLDTRIGLCMDIGHTQRAGVSPAEAVLKCRDRLLDMHIKDVSGKGRGDHAIETGRGIIDFPSLVRNLRLIGYAGRCSIEYEKDMTDPLPGIAESCGFFRGVCSWQECT